MNDADFEMLAREANGAHDCWLRSAALGHAIRWHRGAPLDSELLMSDAKRFLDFIKGESSEPNLHGQKQDER
jgi:hypothetical protein